MAKKSAESECALGTRIHPAVNLVDKTSVDFIVSQTETVFLDDESYLSKRNTNN